MTSEPGASGASTAERPKTHRGLIGLVVSRPVAVSMFMLSMAVFGVVSFLNLRQDLLPEISYPTLTVRTSWPGSAPEDVEQRISQRIQEALSTLSGLVQTSSTSRAGVSDVLLEFDWGTPMTFAVQDVREKLDGVFLPEGVERPLILRYDPNLDPVLRIGITSARDTFGSEDGLVQLRWLAENRLERELESMEGVAAVEVRGGLEEEVRIALDPFALAARQLEPAAVSQRLAAENINAAGGSLLEGSTEYIVRTVNEFEDLDEIRDLAIARRGEATIRLRDVGTVNSGHRRREVVTRIGGAEAVELAIYREAGANIVQLAGRMKTKLFGTPEQQAEAAKLSDRGSSPETYEDRQKTAFLAFQLRKDAELTLLSDQSTFIESAVRDVRDAALLGALFAVLVIWTFLRRLSATLIIAVAIPISVVVTFAPMFLADVSLNIMSLGGLALGVGMLVDNAIVVLESITRCRDEGDDLASAAVRGTREVAGAVTASTLTTISVFAPIVFVSGVAGQIFGDQAVAVVTALAVSLIVALLFIPMLASREALSGAEHVGERPELPRLLEGLTWSPLAAPSSLLLLSGRVLQRALSYLLLALAIVLRLIYRVLGLLLRPFSWLFETAWSMLEGGYPKLLRGVLAAPILVVAGAAGLTFLAVQRFDSLGLELLPEIHQGEFTAYTATAVGNPLEDTDRVMSGLEAAVRELPGVAATALVVGVEAETLSRDIEGPHTARLTVRMEAGSDTASEERLAGRVRELLRSSPAVQSVEIRRPTPFALEAPIEVEVRGHNLETLGRVAGEVADSLRGTPGLVDLRSSLRPGYPEVRVTFDRDKTLEYGLDLASVAKLVRDQIQGDVATRLTRGDERIDVRVAADERLLSQLDDVLNLTVNPGAEAQMPLRSVANVQTVEGPAEIRRIGNSRAVVLEARSSGLDLGGLGESIDARLAGLVLPDDVTVDLGGQQREMAEATRSMLFALLLAVFLVYVVMAAQFESLVQPLIILLTVPLAGIGVVLALDLLGVPLSVVVFIGLIMLAGIVVNNAIVLVDRINQNRARGLEVAEAVVEASRTRLRPILMTTATTALGLLPLTGWLAGVPVIGELGSGEGAELRAPMAVTVITGLVFSTLLTLIVIPSVYATFAKLAPAGRNQTPAH